MNTSATKEPTLSIRPAAGTATTTVAGYLLTRLAEAGVVSVFGVPGDYNLGLLDAVTGRSSMSWIGTASELGAGYATDSYAAGAALTSRAASSYVLRNVRCTIAISRTLIGCDAGILVPPRPLRGPPFLLT